MIAARYQDIREIALRRNKERNFKTNCIWKREFPYKHIPTKLPFTFVFAITLQVF